MAGQGVEGRLQEGRIRGEEGSWERRHRMDRGNRADLGSGAERYRTSHTTDGTWPSLQFTVAGRLP